MKHKLESEINEDDIRVKKAKCGIVVRDEIMLIKQNLNEESNVLLALQDLLKMISSENDGVKFVEQFLLMSSNCKDLFTPIVVTKLSPENIALVWNIVEKILNTILQENEISDKSNFSVHAIASNILHSHLDIMYFSLHRVHKLNIRSSALNCWALMLSSGIQIVREFIKSFQFTACFKQLKECAKVLKKEKQEEDTRSSFVRFYLALIVFGDVPVIKRLLDEKGLSSLLMSDLHLDKVDNISVILETINDKIVNEPNLLRTSKFSFFSQVVLLQLTFLMKHNDATIKSEAANLLTILCTHQRYGICFPPKDDFLNGKLVNPVLLKFLISVKQAAVIREEILELTVETLSTCPDLIVHYMNSLNMAIDPRMSDVCCSRIRLLVKLLEGIPNLEDIMTAQKCELTTTSFQNKDFIMKLTLPHQVTRQVFTQGMKSRVNRVKQACLQLLEVSLTRCIHLKNLLQKTSHTKSQLSDWVDSMMSVLPDVTPLVGIRQMSALSTDDANSSTTIVNNDDDKQDKPLFDPIEMDILLNFSINCLSMYQILKPGILTLSGFNISKLLIFSRTITADVMNRSLDILLNETGTCTWLRKKMSGANNIFYIILKVMLCWSKVEEITTKTKKLFFKVMNATGQFDEYTFEIESWLTQFLSSGRTTSIDDVFAKNFADSCIRTVNEPFMYLENISKLFKWYHQSGSDKADFKLPSPLFFAVLRSMSSETVILGSIVPVLKELLVTHHSPELFIKILLEEIKEIYCSFYEEFLLFSYHWLQKLQLDTSFLSIDGFKEKSLLLEDGLTCVSNIAIELLKINENDLERVESILIKICGMRDKLNISCTVSSVDAMSTFLMNIINICNSMGSLSSCSNLKDFFDMLKSSIKILLKQSNEMESNHLLYRLFSLPLFTDILNIKECEWKHFCQDVYLIFLECCSEFPSSEILTKFVAELINHIESTDAAEVLCKFSSYPSDKLRIDVARDVAISLFVTCNEQQCDEYYTNCLQVLHAIKDIRLNSDMNAQIIQACEINKFLHASILHENSVMLDIFQVIISLFHLDGVMDVDIADYKCLIKLKKSNCLLLMSCLNFQVVQPLNESTGLVCSTMKFNDMFIHDVMQGNISPVDVIKNLLPLLINIVKMTMGSIEHPELTSKLKLLIWKVIIDNIESQESVVSALKLFIPHTTDDEKIEYLSKLKLLLEKKELNDMDVVLEICTKSFSLLSDGKQQKTCLLDLISVVMTTLVRDDIAENVYIVCTQHLVELVLMTQHFKTKLKSDYYVSMSTRWVKFAKNTLKKNYTNKMSMSALLECITVLSTNKRFMKVCSFKLIELYQLIISHSKFFDVMFDEEDTHETKFILIKMISQLAEVSNYNTSLIPMLLSSYEATLSDKDVVILSILHKFEKHGTSLSQFYPFVWGSHAFNIYKEASLNSSLFKERSSAQVLENIEKHKMVKSAREFPIHLSFENCDTTKLCKENYDPLFFLPLFVNLLQMECVVDCYHFIESGCLSFTLAAISSFDEQVRKLAFSILALFNDHLNVIRMREKNQISYMLLLLKNSLSEEHMRFPSIWTCCFIQYIHYTLKPDHHLYTVLNNLILQKPIINTKEMPVFLSLFSSYHMEHSVERCWLLKLLADGLTDITDYYTYRKFHVFELLIAFYDSQVCDKTMKQLIHKVLVAACSINRTSAFDLVKTNSILSWIHGNVIQESSKSEISSFYNLLFTIVNTFRGSSCVTDTDMSDMSDVKKTSILPKLLLNEVILICECALQSTSIDIDYMQFASVYSWARSSANSFGEMNLWLQDSEEKKYFNIITDLLLKIQSGKDGDKISELFCDQVLMLLKKDDVSSLEGVCWKKIYQLGKYMKTRNLMELFDSLIQWCNKIGNTRLLEIVMYAIN